MGKRTESRLPSQERLDEFLQLLRAGNHIATAAGYTGISERTSSWTPGRRDGRPVSSRTSQA